MSRINVSSLNTGAGEQERNRQYYQGLLNQGMISLNFQGFFNGFKP
ncbi:hypothetical protein RintRC_2583 [Richelia intracellularis]|nr:hypothetical protein RintRC_2583 [Richelia intracellularis]